MQGVAAQRVEELQRQIKEIQNEHHDEILQYKGKVTTLEFEVKNKNSQIEVLSSKLKKTDQELEVARNRLQSYEVMRNQSKKPVLTLKQFDLINRQASGIEVSP